MKKLALFGNTEFSKLMKYYIEEDAHREIDCIVVDKEYIKESMFYGIPIISFDEFIGGEYTPSQYEVLICIGYSRMNTIRQSIYNRFKKYGYDIATFIHSSVKLPSNTGMGEGNIVLEDVIIQPFCSIGNCNLFWYNASIAHDCIIGDNNTICGNASLSGFVEIGDNCFLGNNSTYNDHIKIANFTLVGAGAHLSEDSCENSVYVPEKAIKLDKNSMEVKL